MLAAVVHAIAVLAAEPLAVDSPVSGSLDGELADNDWRERVGSQSVSSSFSKTRSLELPHGNSLYQRRKNKWQR